MPIGRLLLFADCGPWTAMLLAKKRRGGDLHLHEHFVL